MFWKPAYTDKGVVPSSLIGSKGGRRKKDGSDCGTLSPTKLSLLRLAALLRFSAKLNIVMVVISKSIELETTDNEIITL